jgi:hypothetical protein
MRKLLPVKWLLLLTLALLPLLLHLAQSTLANTSAISSSFAPLWDQGTLEAISAADTLSSQEPLIRMAPNKTLLIAYKKRVVATPVDHDLYYSRSIDNGSTWSSPAPLYANANTNSAEVDVAFDSANAAHAVWVEGFGLDAVLAYTKSGVGANSWPANYQTITSTSTIPVIIPGLPDLEISDNDTLDVVWQELNNSRFRLNHARKEVGGNWQVTGIVPETVQHVGQHSVAVNGNTLHLVWSERLIPYHIRYSQGTYSGGAVTWSPAITLSESLTSTDNVRPVIAATGGQLQVAFTSKVSTSAQRVLYRQCAANCTNLSSWSSPVTVSGADLQVTSSVSDIISDLTVSSGCTYVYFHGKVPGPSGNEEIWGSRACGSGWSNRHQLPLSLSEAQTINNIRPSLVIDGTWMHLAFERAGDLREIYYIRGNPNAVFLPIMLKN